MKIALVAPSGPPDPELLDAGIRRLIERFGPIEVLRAPNLAARRGYLAGTDAERSADIRWAFEESGATHVWFARGGFGATRIVARLPWAAYARSGVALLGYSDATAFLVAFAAAGGRAFHAPMLATDLGRGGSPRSWESLARLVFAAPPRPRDEFFFKGDGVEAGAGFSGRILAGNIAVLAALAGTPFFPSGAGRVVCLEEVGEEPYRIDRTLTQLKHAGLFRGATGILFGSMTDCLAEAPERSLTVEEVLADFARELDLPAILGFPFGHGGVNTVLPLYGRIGVTARHDGWRVETFVPEVESDADRM